MTTSIGSTSFVYRNGNWNLNIVEKMSHHRAKADTRIEEENYGSLNTAIASIGARTIQYGIVNKEDFDTYRFLRRVYKNALISFKQALLFGKEQIEFSVASQAIPKASYIGFTDNHGVGVHYEQTTDHGRSESGISVECTYPGNFAQVCEKILNIEVGERLLKNENAIIHDLIQDIEAVTKDIITALENRRELNKELRKTYRICAAQNIRQHEAHKHFSQEKEVA